MKNIPLRERQHQFVVTVTSTRQKEGARTALLLAFAWRLPDGCSFTLQDMAVYKRNKKRRRQRTSKASQSSRVPHNPANLTPEQVGPSPWRLLDKDEIRRRKRSCWDIEMWHNIANDWSDGGWYGEDPSSTYRTKLTRAELAKLN